MRIFISIEIPEEIKKEIISIQEKLPEFSGRKTEKENLHLTLKFLGEISGEDAEKTREKLSEIKLGKFDASLGDLGVFNKNFVRIIWIKLDNCEKLQKELDFKLENLFPKEERFMSHLTIARVKNVKDKKKFLDELGKIKVLRAEFSVSEFCLMKSELTGKGPVYSCIEKYRLK